MTSLAKITEWISHLELSLPPPEDSKQLEHWLDTAEEQAEEALKEGDELHLAYLILNIYKAKYELVISKSIIDHTPTLKNEKLIEHMDALCNRPQIEQRTTEWYLQIQRILGASELDDIFGTPLARAKLVMSKADPQPRPSQPLVVLSEHMSAFDWGIRFEPVVKQIYCHKYNAEIKELGRLISDSDHRLSASPDGLVYSGPRMGRLLEIKCPCTREPDGKISKKYYTQMQSQMHVTQIDTCDFVEAVFISKYKTPIDKYGPGLYTGEILVIQTNSDDYAEPILSYMYSPLNLGHEFEPDLQSNEIILERVHWYLYEWHEQIVRADPHWWTNIKPTFDSFWDDVEKAKRGEFVMPESKRKPRKVKEDNCLIVIREGYPESPAEPTPSSESPELQQPSTASEE